MDKMSKITCGIAGEYLVAAELSRRGYSVTVTLKNTESVDILATNKDASKVVAIQVKTKQTPGSKFPLTEKNEHLTAAHLFYVFVDMNPKNNAPVFYIYPSKTVAKTIMQLHKDFLDNPGKNGQKRKDNTMRVFYVEDTMKDKWDILGL